MQYQDMIIEASEDRSEPTADKRRLLRFNVRVLASPAGEMPPEAAVPVEVDERELHASLQKLESRALDREGLIALGRTLGTLLLPPVQDAAGSSIRELFSASLREARRDDGGLRLRLRLPLRLAVLPWEYVYADRAGGGDGMDGFLALDPRVAIVRHEVLAAPAPPPAARGAIKMVVALTSGDGPVLDLAKERTILGQVLEGQEGIAPIFLDDATLSEVMGAIPGAGIFHFAGHGYFDAQMSRMPGIYEGSGTLSLEDETVDAEQVGIGLRGEGVRLVVLGACETGRRDAVNPWSGVAPALVKAEIPAVIANQYPIQDQCAIAFSRGLYQALVGGLSIEHAVSRGRIAAYQADAEGRDWGVPVLYLRAASAHLFEGAADDDVRDRARAEAEADVSVHANTVAAGGEVLGSEVGAMLGGKLAVQVTVGTVSGEVRGATFDKLTGGTASVNVDVDTVEKGGRVVGAQFRTLGG
jgi:hypothetical protein